MNFSEFVLAMVGVVVVSAGLSRAQPFTAFNISNDAANSLYPRTDGRYVVWGLIDSNTSSADVLGYDLLLGQQLTVANSSRFESTPAVDHGIAVWEDSQPGLALSRIRGGNLGGGDAFLVTEANGPSIPNISGNVVVWTETRNDIGSAWGRKLDQPVGSDFQISPTASFHQLWPDVDGNLVVWQSFMEPQDEGNIYGRDLRGGDVFPITTNSANLQTPRVSGNIVVWLDWRDGNPRIYGKDLVSGLEFPISSATRWADMPAIDGDLVVWREGNGTGPTDIFGKFLWDNEVFQITNTPEIDEAWPDVGGRLVIWEQGLTGDDNDIWGAVVPEPTSVMISVLASGLILGRRRQSGACKVS